MGVHILAQGSPTKGIVFPFLILAGWVLIPATIAAWVMAISRQKGKRHPLGIPIVAGVLTVLSAIWGILFWAVNREMQNYAVEDGDAVMIVERLPEVKQYEQAAPLGGLKRSVMIVDDLDPNGSPQTWSIIVGEEGPKGPETTWHRFRVSTKTGEVKVLVDQPTQKWVSLDEWRRLMQTKK